MSALTICNRCSVPTRHMWSVSYLPHLLRSYLIATGALLPQVLCSCMLKVYCFLYATGGSVPACWRCTIPFLPHVLCSCMLKEYCFLHATGDSVPATPFQDLVLLSQAPHRKFASLKVTFSLRVLSFKDFSIWIFFIFWSVFENWTVAEWNLPEFIKEQPDVVVLQGLLVEGGGISVVLHLEVGREGGVGHSAIESLPNWAEN